MLELIRRIIYTRGINYVCDNSAKLFPITPRQNMASFYARVFYLNTQSVSTFFFGSSIWQIHLFIFYLKPIKFILRKSRYISIKSSYTYKKIKLCLK